MRIDIDFGDLSTVARIFGRDLIEKSLLRAVKRSEPSYRKSIVHRVYKRYNVKKRDVSAAFRKTAVRVRGLGLVLAGINVTGRPISLTEFSPRPTKLRRQDRKRRPPGGVKVTVRRGRQQTAQIKGTRSLAFWDETSIYARRGKSRFPTRRGYGPPIPFMVEETLSQLKITEQFAQRVQRELADNIEFRIRRKLRLL